jgi:hypothetical protein
LQLDGDHFDGAECHAVLALGHGGSFGIRVLLLELQGSRATDCATPAIPGKSYSIWDEKIPGPPTNAVPRPVITASSPALSRAA